MSFNHCSAPAQIWNHLRYNVIRRKTIMFAGPQPQDRAARLRVVDKIVHDLHATHGDRLIAIGLYGSLAKGVDGPFSDIELFCVVQGNHIDYSHEWVYGVNKAEVNIYSLDVVEQRATQVD